MQLNASARARSASRPIASARAPVKVQALFGFGKAPTKSNKAGELVKKLVQTTVNTKAGTSVKPDVRAEIEQLVGQLRPFSVKNAMKSTLLTGEYEVVYVSDPSAPGAPFEGPDGVIPFSGKLPTQTITDNGEVVNGVTFKTFGIVEGFSKQTGQVKATGTSAYSVDLSLAEFKSGLGPSQKIPLESTLNVEILYLGDELRIVKNSVEGEDNSDCIIVYKRIGVEIDDDDEEEEDVPAAKPAPAFGSQLFGGGSKKESFATVSERQVRRQMEEDKPIAKSAGTSFLKSFGTKKVVATQAEALKAGTKKVVAVKVDPKTAREDAKKAAEKARAEKVKEAEQIKAERAKSVEDKKKEADKIKAEREADAAKRVAEAQAVKERAIAEKEAALAKQGDIKELLATLADQLKEAQSDNKDAQMELKDIERSAASAMREAGSEKTKIEAAEEDSAEAKSKLDLAIDAKTDADNSFKRAKAALSGAQSDVKKAESAMIVKQG